MTFDALIIGGGPAGATTALLLARAGWSVAIVEKKTFPRRKVCGEFISATSLPLLEKLGVADFYLAHAGPEVKRVGLFANKTSLISEMPIVNCALGKWGRALGREHLDLILLDMAAQAGAKLWQPYSVNDLQRETEMFTCNIIGDEVKKISARIVIMANGSWERNLEQPRIHTHKPSDLLAFKAHFKNSDLAVDLMPLIAFPGGYGGLVNTDNERITLSCCIRRDTLQYIRRNSESSAGETVLQHIMSTCLGAHHVLHRAQREGNWLAAGPIQPGIRKRYAKGIFFVGNIAGEAHPIIAEGISMALQSAGLLAEVLVAQQNNINYAGEEYAKRWELHFKNRIRVSALIAQLAMRPWAVKLLLPLLKQYPNVLSYGAKLSGKVHLVPNL